MTAASLPTLEDVLNRAHVVALPMRVPFRGIRHRELVVIDGPAGWGEFAPFLEYAAPEASRWLASALESSYAVWPRPLRPEVAINATVPAVGPAQVPAILARFPGVATVKVKVAEAGQELRDDLDRVAAVREVMGPAARIRIDANGAWSLAQATAALGRLAAYVRDARIPLEMCPSSNLQTGAAASYREHPITVLKDLRFRVTVNTDNRLMSGTTLGRELQHLVDEAGWTLSDVRWATINAMKSAFIPYDERLALIEKVIKPGYAALGVPAYAV